MDEKTWPALCNHAAYPLFAINYIICNLPPPPTLYMSIINILMIF